MKQLLVACILLACGCLPAQTPMKIYLSDRLIPCGSAAEPRNCMQMKESRQGNWQTFYNNIEGFEYAEGYQYRLLVQATYHDTKQADGFNLSYKLLRQLCKKKTGYNPVSKLCDKKWVLLSLHEDKSNLVTTDTNTYIMLNTSGQRLQGASVCNHLSGTFTADATHLQFQSVGMTKKLCESSSITIENIIRTLLQNVTTWQLTGNRLTLTATDGAYLVFEKH